jgi:hypothetical protein
MRMHGPAGTGKMTLSQTIGGRCKREWVTCSQFLLSRGRNNGQSLLPTVTLAYQISYPEARYFIWKPIETSLINLFKRSWKSSSSLRSATGFASFHVELLGVSSFKQLVVIYGLDEYEDPRIQCDILRAITTATKRLRLPFRFLVASRPEP